MKGKLKQWWSTISPISTKWTITSHLYLRRWKFRPWLGTGLIDVITLINMSIHSTSWLVTVCYVLINVSVAIT
jgi:hypothetical protein